MTYEKAFLAYLVDLNFHLHEQMGAHVQRNLEEAITMDQWIEVYQGGDGLKGKGQTNKKLKEQKKVSLT